jgi:NAD(P)H-hydrate epimerase
MFADKTCKDLLTIKANYTLSFQTYKMCFLMAENETAVGELYILDIGLLKEYEAQEPTPYTLIEKNNIQQIYRPRKKFAHKGNFGHALILAGSYGKMGAAVLSAKACLRSGVGLLTMHVPEVGYEIIQVSVPEAMATIDEIMSYMIL